MSNVSNGRVCLPVGAGEFAYGNVDLGSLSVDDQLFDIVSATS